MTGAALTTLWEMPLVAETQVMRLRRGDPSAFEELLAEYQHRLYRYLLRMARDEAVAEDLFQQTWLKVVEKIKQYDPQRNFEAWLFSVARNLAIDFFRRHRPESLDEPVGDNAGSETRASLLAADAPSALENLLARERAERVAKAMETLSWTQREVLTLRFEEEMKIVEIAETLSIPLSTAKTRLRRGLEALGNRLRQEPEARA